MAFTSDSKVVLAFGANNMVSSWKSIKCGFVAKKKVKKILFSFITTRQVGTNAKT